MVTDKFVPNDTRHQDPKLPEIAEKGQEALKAEKKELKFTSHTIKSGENLSGICKQYGIPLKALYAVNQHELDPVLKRNKDGTIAAGAPTYHVGDKLNIPSQAAVPNAVKYFDIWAKSVLAKQQLEPKDSGTQGKPAGAKSEKQYSKTQMLDDEHLAARSAALMVKVASETKYNQFRTQHEGQGGVDDAWDWLKTNLKVGDSSGEIERDFANQRGLVKVLEKAAKNQDLTQFKNLYQQCTGKSFDAKNFSSAYKKPAALAFPDLADQYEKSQETGRKGARVALATGVASLAVIPGAAPFALEGAHAVLATTLTATALGSAGGALGDYANSGDITKTGEGAKEGAIVGASIGIASTLGIASQGRAAAAWGKDALIARVGTAAIGNATTGGVAGGLIEGGLTTKNDLDQTGKVDIVRTTKATVHGTIIGAGTGAAIGITAPLAEGVIAARAAQAASTSEAAPLASAATAEADAAAAQAAATASRDKTAAQNLSVDTTGTTKWQKGSTLDPASEGATPTQPDLSKVAPASDTTGSTKWQKGSTLDPPKEQSAGAPSDGTASAQMTPKTGNWQKGNTLDMKPKEKPPAEEQTMSEERPSEAYMTRIRERAQQIIDDGNNWVESRLKSLGGNAKETQLDTNWKCVEYTDPNGVKTVEAYQPVKGVTHTTRTYKEKGITYQDDIVTQKDGQSMWRKQKQVETKKSIIKRQDDPDIIPEYEWETIDSPQMQMHAREQAAKAKSQTE